MFSEMLSDARRDNERTLRECVRLRCGCLYVAACFPAPPRWRTAAGRRIICHPFLVHWLFLRHNLSTSDGGRHALDVLKLRTTALISASRAAHVRRRWRRFISPAAFSPSWPGGLPACRELETRQRALIARLEADCRAAATEAAALEEMVIAARGKRAEQWR